MSINFHIGSVSPPRVVSLSSVNLSINTLSFTMKCIPDDERLEYTWEKQDGVLSRAHGINSSHLTLLNLTVENAGRYRCIVHNSTGRIASDYIMLTIKGDSYKVTSAYNYFVPYL